MDLILIIATGVLTGIIIGLFPVFPIYFGAFILYLLSDYMNPEYMLLFWAITIIGSQFFTSISSITMGIPGDASSLIYIRDIKDMSSKCKNQLLYQTSRGSLVGGTMGLFAIWGLFHFYNATNQTFLSSIELKMFLLYSVILFYVLSSERKFFTAVIAFFGLLIAPANNYSLPQYWYQFSLTFQNVTFFMLVLTLLIIPDLLKQNITTYKIKNQFSAETTPMPWWLVIKSSAIGCIVGLVPGPSAELSASIAYSVNNKLPTDKKIIAAESANNSGAVMMILPLMLLGLPFTASSLIISNIMDSKLIDLPELTQSSSSIISGISVFDGLIVFCLVATVLYYFLSTHFINFYTNSVQLLQGRFYILLVILLIVMTSIDIYVQQTSILIYLCLTFVLLLVGLILKYFKINPTPLIFVYLLGDQLIWTTIQYASIHF